MALADILNALTVQELASLGPLGLRRAYPTRPTVVQDMPCTLHWFEEGASERDFEGTRTTEHRGSTLLLCSSGVDGEAELRARPFIAAYFHMMDTHITLGGTCWTNHATGYRAGRVAVGSNTYYAVQFNLVLVERALLTFAP